MWMKQDEGEALSPDTIKYIPRSGPQGKSKLFLSQEHIWGKCSQQPMRGGVMPYEQEAAETPPRFQVPIAHVAV